MPEELDVLLDVARRLDDAGIPYMVTGSIALSLYARPRMTRDIDIVVELRRQDVDQFIQALGDTYLVTPESVRDSLSAGPGIFNVIHEETIIKIDFIIRKGSKYHRQEFARRMYQPLEGHRLAVVTREDLILSKLLWAKDTHSEMQLRDVKSLIEDADRLDHEYLERWVNALGLKSLWEEAQA